MNTPWTSKEFSSHMSVRDAPCAVQEFKQELWVTYVSCARPDVRTRMMRFDDIRPPENWTIFLSFLQFSVWGSGKISRHWDTECSTVPGLTAGSKPAVTDDTSPAKTDQSKEMYNVLFLMHMPKDYEQYRLPENFSSENEEKKMHWDNHQKNTTSIDSRDNPVTRSNVPTAAETIEENIFTVNNNGYWWLQKSENASCMVNENIGFGFLGKWNFTLSCWEQKLLQSRFLSEHRQRVGQGVGNKSLGPFLR